MRGGGDNVGQQEAPLGQSLKAYLHFHVQHTHRNTQTGSEPSLTRPQCLFVVALFTRKLHYGNKGKVNVVLPLDHVATLKSIRLKS